MQLPVFPVTASTLSATHLGQYLKEKYTFSESVTCRLFRTGINHLYFVNDAEKKYVFRIYTFNWRTELEISEEARLLLHLKDNHIPVSYPLPDKNDNYILEIDAPEGKRYGVLFSYAEGGKVSNFTPEISYTIGVAMAKMHQATQHLRLERVSYTPTVLLTDSLATIKSFFKEPSDEIHFIERTTYQLLYFYEQINSVDIRTGAIHLDIWFDNMHIQDDGTITIFDFDFCGNGWLCYDISYFVIQLFNTHANTSDYQLKADSFLKGYESMTPISEEEKRIMPFIAISIWFFYLRIQCEKFDTWSNIFLNKDHLKRFLGIIKRWIAFNGLPLG